MRIVLQKPGSADRMARQQAGSKFPGGSDRVIVEPADTGRTVLEESRVSGVIVHSHAVSVLIVECPEADRVGFSNRPTAVEVETIHVPIGPLPVFRGDAGIRYRVIAG